VCGKWWRRMKGGMLISVIDVSVAVW
jgi:hypothetical protein